ncbi:hypothetical protein J2755_001955 [Methanohalophilus levihalophilus]|nr:DUF366 family protein [Methanohalophilus levihalophilus]MBP2031007.1 hypothetical protein [Methanohalophilus levihalophilus]
MIEAYIMDEKIDYDGSQISSLWAYSAFGIQSDSIVAFRGACDVVPDHMIDLEDLRQNESIESPDMLHFIVEHFDSTDLKLVYARQRLFTTIFASVLADEGIEVGRDGDDLFVNGKKLSISIASTSAISQKIHFGVNVTHDFYGNLKEAGMSEERAINLLDIVSEKYAFEMEDIEADLRKSRQLGVF